MRRLVEITFMSLDGVIDAPDVVGEARRYFAANDEHESYQRAWLFAADALLLGRKTYESLSRAYLGIAQDGSGPSRDFVARMNSIPKYIASRTLKQANWNASVIHGDLAEEVKALKAQAGKDIVKYGTGSVDRFLFDQHLIDLFCLIIYPFALGHGLHLFEDVEPAMHMNLSDMRRFRNGTLVLEYIPQA